MTAAQEVPVPGDDVVARASAYERLADLFATIYSETHSIPITLEFLDAERAREPSMSHVMDLDLPDRVVEIAASIFHIRPARRLLRPDRHRDICRARWIASSLLRQQGWSTPKIGRFLGIDHSTVIHGLQRVANDVVLRRVAAAAARVLVTQSALRGA